MKFSIGIFFALLFPAAGVLLTDAPAVWPLSILVYNLALFRFFSGTPFPGRGVVFGLIAAILFTLETSYFISYYIQNAGFNDAFFYHLRPDLLFAGISEHALVLVLYLLCLCGLLFLTLNSLAGATSKKIFQPLYVILFLAGLYFSPSASDLWGYFATVASADSQADVYLHFPELRNPKAAVEFVHEQRPNIILIYAESLEHRYFDAELFPGLTPGLNALKKRSMVFSDVAQGVGASWTVGGIFASQCGYPLAGPQGVDGNELSVFDTFLPEVDCLGDFLADDGYRLTFIGGADERFAGKGDFLRSHGYQEVIDLDDLKTVLSDPDYLNEWGVFDDSMFDYAFETFDRLSREQQPFLLTLLTLDAHGPTGYLSRSCKPYGSGEISSLNSFHCSDQLISAFIDKVRSSSDSENTLIIVLSDHLAMRNRATPLLNASKLPKRLTFLVNTADGKSVVNDNPGYHYDVAPTILDLIGYRLEGQMGFGASLLQGPGYLARRLEGEPLAKHASELMAISRSLWQDTIMIDGQGIVFNDEDLSLTLGGRTLNLRSWGFAYNLASSLLVFDPQSLTLEKVSLYPFDRELDTETLSRALVRHEEQLVLTIARAKNLPGFAYSEQDPEEWVYFFGKPGSGIQAWGPLTATLIIPYEVVAELSTAEQDPQILKERRAALLPTSRSKAAGGSGS